MGLKVITKTIVTNASGAGSNTMDISGIIHKIRYEKTDFANGVDFAIKDTETEENIWTP